MPQTRDRNKAQGGTPRPDAGRAGTRRTRRRNTAIVRAGDATLAASFDRINTHRRQAWARGELFSGDHATPGATSALVRSMRAFIRDREIRSIVDIGTGDMDWWVHVLGDTPEGAITFRSFDICPNVVRHNRDAFLEREDWTFEMADARFHDFPAADLTVCRRTLNYLWSADAAAARENICRHARLVAISHDPELRSNRPDGMRRAYADDAPRATAYTRMNLRRPPFMPMPVVATIPDDDDEVLAVFPARAVN